MAMDYLENILQLSVTLVMQVLCLFQYIKHRRRGYVYLIVFFLSSLISTYYWTAYLLIMGDSPNVSDLFTYAGWNIAEAALLMLVLHFKTPKERRYFHPLMLLPIPLNVYQLTLYLPFGGAANSIYQVAVYTAVAVFCIQSICWHRRNGRDGGRKPYVAWAVLMFAACEFGMWTSSCFDWPSTLLNPYYYFSILSALDGIALGWAVKRAYGANTDPEPGELQKRHQRNLKLAYLSIVLVCCLGGLALGYWMRSVLVAGMLGLSGTRVYDIIPVVLFLCSLIIVAFAVAIILLVNYGQKAAESDALREAKAVAERSNASKSEFLANMSHEIRTPINAMLGMNEIIMRESLRARDALPRDREAVRRVFGELCACAGNIDSAGTNLLAIINDILDFSKIEAGRLEITEGDYKLSSVLNDVSNMILFKARAKALEFRVDVDDALPDGLRGDEVRVRQVITNLLNNAVKYTNAGSVCLSVRRGDGSEIAEGALINLVVTIQDTGIGIRKEDMDRLFDKFERFDLDRNSTIEGTGLGLAITHKLLNLMGGSIAVRSVYGEGSIFTAVIPQHIVSCEPVGNFREKFARSIDATRPRRERFRAPDARVLVVDDTRMNIAVVTGLLRNTGIQADTAEGGEAAVTLARANRYDVILMDQRMPGMDGTEALHHIRSDGLNRRTPVICVTADAVGGARERYLAAGFDGYLTKPIDGDSLEDALLAFLPPEKVGEAGPADDDANWAGEAAPGELDFLRALDVDAKTGLHYCQGDGALYLSLLAEYAQGGGEKADALQRYRDAGDWKNYGILAHALKSSSRMIGAADLSDMAADLEEAAGRSDGAAIARGHDAMLMRYRALCEGLAARVGRAEADAGDDVLEFLPD